MNGKREGDLILFPKSIDYYQIELTKLLEKEAYGEAIRMLEFLVSCRTDDDRSIEEWTTLLGWLRTEFPDAADEAGESDDDGPGEEELLKRYVAAKASQDKRFVKRLLDTLAHAPLDRQLLALDQLAHIEEDDVADRLKEKLLDPQLHPFVGFKLLQTLAKLGASGETTFGKLGEIVTVDVERTPLSADQFPEPLPLVVERVQQMAETDDPTVSYFAQQTWEEFLTYVYGTSTYRDMVGMDEQMLDVWAAALHGAVSKAMYGTSDPDDLKDRYGITESLEPSWERAAASIAEFFRDGAGIHV